MKYKVKGWTEKESDFEHIVEGQPAVEDRALVFWGFTDGKELMVRAYAEGYWHTCEKAE